MFKQKLFSISLIGLVLLFTGCNDDDDSYITAPNTQDAIEVQEFGGEASQRSSNANATVYRVDFEALNPDAGYSAVNGVANLRITGDRLTVQVNAQGLQPGMIHPQHIHASDSCPEPAADTNEDGFIDVLEGVPSYGPIFVSLDGDLANLDFETTFPKPMNKAGAITYSESASVSELEAATGEALDLDGRHIVLHGVSAETDLPESVQSIAGLPSYLTLPVACGEIVRVN